MLRLRIEFSRLMEHYKCILLVNRERGKKNFMIRKCHEKTGPTKRVTCWIYLAHTVGSPSGLLQDIFDSFMMQTSIQLMEDLAGIFD